MRVRPLTYFFLAILVSSVCSHLSADEPESSSGDDIQAGHSFHGEAFNEGPRQAAYLMPGMGSIDFPVSTQVELTQKFIQQGVAQLHGFWYYEAERSFRQAAVHDPDCAMCFWGMGLANVENRKRAREFIAQAVAKQSAATRREQLYIQAAANFFSDKDPKGKTIDKKLRAQNHTRDLELIVEEFPSDLDAKALLALQLWQNERAGLPIISHVAIDSVLRDIFDADPLHPAHHYRIHLWDRHKPERALASAAACGPSLPGIAHMWHMPGHIYSKLHRYHDAAWQQEASARVDHAHMMRDRVLPDQIHNYAHNNEWLIRNLLKLGRVEDALALAKNMLELPRHPSYNTLQKGSAKFGRERLWLTLSTYRLWPLLIELAHSEFLEPTNDVALQQQRLRYLGVAYALDGQLEQAAASRAELQNQLVAATSKLEDLKQQHDADTAPPDTAPQDTATKDTATEESAAEESGELKRPLADEADQRKAKVNRTRRQEKRQRAIKEAEEDEKRLQKLVAAIESAEAAAVADWSRALNRWEESDLDDPLLKAEWLAAAGEMDESLRVLETEIEKNPQELLPYAVKLWIQAQCDHSSGIRETYEVFRLIASAADMETPLLDRLLPLTATLDSDPTPPAPYQPPPDVGARPDLESLGPLRWQPYLAPDFRVDNSSGSSLQMQHLQGQPTLIIFYLGFGCLHCVEQLHEFAPRAEEFREAGIEMLAISSENRESLTQGLEAYPHQLKLPLHADPELDAFKAFRCFDDFEQQPLHGTFLLDTDGRVRWQDISFEPFMDVDFVLAEAQRLLAL